MDKIIYCKNVSIFISNHKYGLMNSIGEIIIPPVYDNIYYEVMRNDPSNETDIISGFSDNGIAKVKKDNLYGFINEYGIEILECKYNEAYLIGDMLFNVKIGSFWTIVDGNNKARLPLFDEIYNKWYNGYYTLMKSNQIYGLAIYKKGNKLGLLNITTILTPPIYDDIQIQELYSGNLYIPTRQQNKWGIINTYGDIILNCNYDRIVSWGGTNFTEEWNEVYHKKSINVTIPTKECFNNILENWKLSEEDPTWKKDDFEAYVIQNNKYGLVSTWGRTIVPCLFNSIEEVNAKRIEFANK